MSYYLIENPGYFEIKGEDGIDFLQRQTTNDVHKFDRKSALVTVLTSPKARILDVLTLLPGPTTNQNEGVQENCMLILSLPGYGTSTVKFLTDRIFFMDKVSISEMSGDFIQIELYGDGADSTMIKIGFEAPPDPGEILSTENNGYLIRTVGRINELQLGYRLLVTLDKKDSFLNLMKESGALPVNEEQFNALRIEAGIPRAGYELSSDYTPLEVGLKNMVSEIKGCYTGQEVIARQINYDKVTKHLSGLKLQEGVKINERIWFDGKFVGVITSAGYSERHGDIALAIVKRPHNQPGTELYVGQSSEDAVMSQVVELPFTN